MLTSWYKINWYEKLSNLFQTRPTFLIHEFILGRGGGRGHLFFPHPAINMSPYFPVNKSKYIALTGCLFWLSNLSIFTAHSFFRPVGSFLWWGKGGGGCLKAGGWVKMSATLFGRRRWKEKFQNYAS